MKRTGTIVACCVALLLGGVLGRWSSPEMMAPEVPRAVGERPDTLAESEPGRLRAALAEKRTFQKTRAILDLLQSMDPSSFPALWERMENDETARSILIEHWLLRDLSGLAQFSPNLPREMFLAVLKRTQERMTPELRASFSKYPLGNEPLFSRHDLLHKLNAIDPQVAAEVAKSGTPLDETNFTRRLRDAEVGKLIAEDPRALFRGGGGDYENQERITAIQTIAREDPDEAIEIAGGQASPARRAHLSAAIAGAWAEKEPVEALLWTLENLEGNPRADALRRVLLSPKWRERDRLERLDYVDAIPDRWTRKILTGSVFDHWAEDLSRDRADDLETFVEEITAVPAEDLPLNNGDIGFMWPNVDLESAAAYLLDAPPDLDLNLFAYYVAQRFSHKKYGPIPEAGVEWAGTLTLERGKSALNTIIQSNDHQPEVIADAMARLPEGKLRSEFMPHFASKFARKDLEQAKAWATATGDPAAVEGVEIGERQLKRSDPFAE